ncbi:flavin-nucleotide-binding protein [Paenibacillus sp. FSL R7-0273]|uniref:pyridoxamine 5'-phosphate oxidase family protein n=1 Tax=Paenibacillus sp. FSL R7-0273 TaxID=1536772 RepID=UPI0004F60FC3|nr:pyridoxamine 5'-phosphate oxidase family protein [Paenibacillus sp. FSL R7-0273]AIQ49144.1 flavin-nucleotide-binding protein [Paenibacillus sp. FSL R7-0273]OMF87832.1 flavin-nucleotide-binding protein [Paenibacillus sp. FSL R7-0273]
MRRKEFKIEQEEEITAFLQAMSFGFLGTVDEQGHPRVTPLNFVYSDGSFYFHGSHAGGKMDSIRRHKQVCFTVADEFALIPSYFSDPELACPATAYFKSVTAYGQAELVEDLTEKAAVMSLFMQKLQPEGGYIPITADDPKYRPGLRAVAVVRITPGELTAKFKFGQNLKEDKRNGVISGLTERGGVRDAETLEMMQKFCPYHS